MSQDKYDHEQSILSWCVDPDCCSPAGYHAADYIMRCPKCRHCLYYESPYSADSSSVGCANCNHWWTPGSIIYVDGQWRPINAAVKTGAAAHGAKVKHLSLRLNAELIELLDSKAAQYGYANRSALLKDMIAQFLGSSVVMLVITALMMV